MKVNYFRIIILWFSIVFVIPNAYSQWKYPNVKNIKDDVIIKYDVKYDRDLSEKEKQSPRFKKEIVVVFNQDKLLLKNLSNRMDVEYSVLLDYKNQIAYDRRRNGDKREAVKSKFKNPKKETFLQVGKEEIIIGFPCKVSTAKIKGKMREIYTTKKIGLKFVKNFNTEGFLLKYTANDKYFGPYTVTAKEIFYSKLPESTYSIEGFKVRTPQEQKEYTNQMTSLRGESKDILVDKIGSKSPKFSVRSIRDKKFKSKDLIGKIVVLNFWFTTCGTCKKEIPQLNELKNRYKGKDVEFIAIGLDLEYKIDKFRRKIPFNYHLIEDGRWLASKFDVTLYPANIIIDKQGVIQFYKTGYKSDIKEAMSFEIDKLLAAK